MTQLILTLESQAVSNGGNLKSLPGLELLLSSFEMNWDTLLSSIHVYLRGVLEVESNLPWNEAPTWVSNHLVSTLPQKLAQSQFKVLDLN